MRNFSIASNSNMSVIDQYSEYLAREVYYSMRPFDIEDPLFLQQMGVLQAEGIRRAININTSVNYGGFEEINETINNSASFIGHRLGRLANIMTSSLDDGFAILNKSLVNIDNGIETTNSHLNNIHNGINTLNAGIHNVHQSIDTLKNTVERGFGILNYNLTGLRNMVGAGFSKLYAQSCMTNTLLKSILEELKIPETQRERRYHIEEGTKYLSTALNKGDKLYFEDALDEFNKAISIERKDFFSWFNLGIIYLRSREHIDIAKAIDAFEKYLHYARAELSYKKNQKLEYQMDDVHLYLAESYYLQQKFKEAIYETEQCTHTKDKADFMKVKYLSATNDNSNKQTASEILSKLIKTNPYIILQVLNDDDILKNNFIDTLSKKLQQDTVKKAENLFGETKRNFKNTNTFYLIKDTLSKIENLLRQQTFLQSCEAIYRMEKEYKWKLKDGSEFTSTISDFEDKEKNAINIPLINRYIGEGLVFHRSKQYEEAVSCFNQALELDPNNRQALLKKIISLHSIIENGDKFHEYFKKGNQFFNSGQDEKADSWYRQALELESNNKEFMLKGSDSLRNVRRMVSDRMSEYNEYWSQFDNCRYQLHKNAYELMEAEKYEEALEYYDIGTKIYTDDNHFHFFKAECLKELERKIR